MECIKKFLSNITEEKRAFLIFLLIHLIVWSCLGLIRAVLPADTIEGIYWGSLLDIGTNKHPPLAGWIAYFVWNPTRIDFLIYLTCQIFVIGGFIYTYKFAKYFLSENKALLSVILLEGCWVYSYMGAYNGFNPNFILFFTLPAMMYYFYKSLTENKISDWSLLGIITGLSFWGKYQTIFLVIPLLIWAAIYKREIFKNLYFYLSFLIAFIIFIPHVMWLFANDFFPFGYIDEKLINNRSFFNSHVLNPISFLVMQLVATIGSFVIFSVLKIKNKQVSNVTIKQDEAALLLLAALLPNILQTIPAFLSGSLLNISWGFEFLFLVGIILFYFIPVEVDRKNYFLAIKTTAVIMFLTFASLATLFTVEKNFRSRYPAKAVFNQLNEIYYNKFHKPIKYIGGHYEYAMQLAVINNTKFLLDTYGHENPWLDETDLIKNGAMIVARDEKTVLSFARKVLSYIGERDIEAVPFKFVIYNALRMPREYEFHYVIIPPEDF